MFGSLRKKFTEWIKKPKEDEIEEKEEIKTPKVKKESKKTTKKTSPSKEKKTKSAKIKDKKVEKKEKEISKTDEKVESEEPEKIEDTTPPQEKEKKSFWPFKKKDKTEDEKVEDVKTPDEKEIKESPKEELKEEFEEEEEKGFFSKIRSKLTKSKLSQEDFDEAFYELEITLLENNVSLEVVDKLKSSLESQLVEKDIKKSEIETTIIDSLKHSIESVLIEPPNLLKDIKESKKPYVILFFGINGSGKTTSIAKLTQYLKENKLSVCLAAGDTFRAAAVEQLETHADKLKVPIIKHDYNSDPAAVGYDAISYAKKNNTDVVLIDTAGRMYTASNLLREMEKIVKVTKPNLKIFVGESITGNDATEQAKTFNESIGIDGIILTKADIDEKAGTILSVSYITNKPIYFLGMGQEYNKLQPFKKEIVLKNLGLEE